MKERKSFYLDANELKYILDYKKEHCKSSRNEALSCILKEHKSKSEMPIQPIYEYLSKEIATVLKKELNDSLINKLVDLLKPQLNSLKFASNSSNKDIKIMLELLNGIYYKEDYGSIPSIEKIPSDAYKISKERVETIIAREHYRKSNTLD